MTPLLHLPVFLTAAVALVTSSVFKAPDGNFELLILHNNDMHARFEQTSQLSGACTTADREAGKCYGGFPRVAHVVKEARKAAASGEGPPVLYLNAGDTYTGTAWFTIYKWKVAAEFLNALQPDAVSLGNHEFDNGVSGLTPFIENLTTPVLAANLILNKVPELASETNLRKSVVFNVSGTAVGVIGYLTPETKMLAVHNNVEYIDEIVALREEVKSLKKEGVNIIIALGHSGYLRDMEIAKAVDGIALVIGGHSNTFLWNGSTPDSDDIQGPYPTYVTQASGKQVPVVQAYAYTKYLGKLHMFFDSNGNVLKIDGNPILLDNTIPQDPEVLKIVEKYKTDVLNITEEVIGKTSVVLDGLSCQYKECNLGNLIADAMVYRYATEYKGKYWTDAPIAAIQGGGIRSSITNTKTPTNVTKGDLLGVMPFEGILVTVKMNGNVLLQMLEYGVSNYDLLDYPGEFLQVSGIRVVFDLRKPSGSRIINAEARCAECDIPSYTKIEHNQVYKVIIPNFLAKGGDGYWMFEGLPTQALDYNELAATISYIKQYSPVFHGVEGRVTLFDGNDANYSIAVSPSLFMLLFTIVFNFLK